MYILRKMSIFADLVRYIESFLGLITSKYDDAVAVEGLSECVKGIKRIQNAMRSAKTIGEKQHLEACLRNIKSLRVQLKAAQKKGAGINTRPEGATERVHWEDSESAFKSRVYTGIISNLKHKNPKAFLVDAKALFKRRIQTALKKGAVVKANCVFGGEFEVMKGDGILNEYKYFTTSNSAIYRDTNLDTWFDNKFIAPLMRELEEFQERDSGWDLKKVVNINKYTPQLRSSYIELPPQITKKHVNVKNYDQACFAYAVIHLHYIPQQSILVVLHHIPTIPLF